MPHYTAPLDDISFVLHDVLKVSEQNIPGYADLTPDLTEQILKEAGRLASEVLAPINLSGDQQGCSLKDGKVSTPEGVQAAHDALVAGGWMSLDLPEEYGGQDLPSIVGMAASEAFIAANLSATTYSFLTHGAFAAIHAHGSNELKRTYLPKMGSGQWTGTMNLTEPHCGTDLGLMRTKAVPQEDGTYRISGSKIFITAGDHELSENIIHLVLAKIPGGPDGIKGVSLFLVPKYLVDENGEITERNGVSTGGVEHKMGIRASATCALNYDDAVGYLVGEEHKGMRAMFTMMNEARIGTGAQAYCIATAAYQNSVSYARERLQGRAATGPENPDGPADPLIVHPDIRRNLMDQRSYIEAARLFTLWCSLWNDRTLRSKEADAEGVLSLLTPVLKAFTTDKGLESTINAQQVLGGHGYIEEWGMSQFVRDTRITQIYEGANGVQALDLIGRKIGAGGGKYVMAFGTLIKELADRLHEQDDLGEMVAQPLMAALGDFQQACGFIMQNGSTNPNAALSGATDFLHLMGHLCFGYMHALSAEASKAALVAKKGVPSFYEQKLLTAQHYMTRHLPMTRMHLKRIQAGSGTVMGLNAAAF